MEIKFVCCAAVCAIALSLSGCVTLPTSFTTENVMNVHQGMGSDEILKMFGTPKNVSQAVCGASTGKPWTCTLGDTESFLTTGRVSHLLQTAAH
jgi:hypothetical protein